MIFNIQNHGHIALQLGSGKCPNPTLFSQPVCNMLAPCSDSASLKLNPNPPSSVADAAEHVLHDFFSPRTLPSQVKSNQD